MKLFAPSVVALCAVAWAAPAFAQDPPAPQTAVDKFKAARELIATGKLDLAAVTLKSFLDTPPKKEDYLALEQAYGPTVFQRLLRVVEWSENKEADADARKTVGEIIRQANEVARGIATDPARIRRFVANLGKSAGEREFAIDQLAPAGGAAVPELVTSLRSSKDEALRAGILDAVVKLPVGFVPGLVVACEPASDLPDDAKAGLLKAITSRPDVAQLVDRAETNPSGVLWYHAATAGPQLKATAEGLLEAFTGGISGRRAADAELVRLAEPLAARKGNFASLDGMSGRVTLWVWDAGTNAPKPAVMDKADAEEYLALKYLRWAVKASPKSDAAQLAFLGVATERAVERGGFGDLKASAPGVYGLLAAAPDGHLSALLEQALGEGRTALAVGVLQAMSDRGQKDEPNNGTPSPYARALSDKDVRVQFAAAVALLRAPGVPSAAVAARVVDVLRRALGVAATDDQAAAGRAVIADPTPGRADRLAAQFRDLGFAVEKLNSGRDLLRRVAKASDIDLIVVDRHLTDPLLNDVLSHLDADPNAGRRPVLVVASSDKPKLPPLEVQLLRLAVLVAATEVPAAAVPPPYAYDPKFPPTQKPGQSFEQAVETARWERIDARNAALGEAAAVRVKRLRRLVDAADLPTSRELAERLDARLPQLTYGVLLSQFGVSKANPRRPHPSALDPASADALRPPSGKDDAADRLAAPPDPYLIFTDLNELVRSQRAPADAAAKLTDTASLGRLIEQVEGNLDPDARKRVDALAARVMPGPLLIDVAEYRDRDLEARLNRQVKGFKCATVLPEPFGAGGLADDLKRVVADPALRPRADAEKLATAKLAARWLGKIASGAVPGYSIGDTAQADMRAALRSDDLAPELFDGLAELGSGDTQVALVRLAANAGRPVPIRTQAADAAARHIQAFGKYTPADVAQVVRQAIEGESDAVLRGKLAVLNRLVAGKPTDLGAAVGDYAIPLRTPAADPAPPKEQPKPDPKPPEEKK